MHTCYMRMGIAFRIGTKVCSNRVRQSVSHFPLAFWYLGLCRVYGIVTDLPFKCEPLVNQVYEKRWEIPLQPGNKPEPMGSHAGVSPSRRRGTFVETSAVRSVHPREKYNRKLKTASRRPRWCNLKIPSRYMYYVQA